MLVNNIKQKCIYIKENNKQNQYSAENRAFYQIIYLGHPVLIQSTVIEKCVFVCLCV